MAVIYASDGTVSNYVARVTSPNADIILSKVKLKDFLNTIMVHQIVQIFLLILTLPPTEHSTQRPFYPFKNIFLANCNLYGTPL